ncbi:hypothetical protein GF373_03720, partial [bacterium]|nr:hypothetical protein [bacterium]
MRKALQIAFYEAKMSSRGWRFWLLLFLILGISLFARRDYLIHTKLGYYLHAGYSFQHPSFWLMLAILGIGTVALALDTCGRLQKTRMDKIFFPLPVGAMEIMWGRLLGVLLVMVPIATIALSSLALWQWMHGHGYIVWQPFSVALLMLVFPLLLPIAALTITMRTYLKHDFAALLASLLLGGGIWYWGQVYKLLLDIAGLLHQLENASPTLGANFS